MARPFLTASDTMSMLVEGRSGPMAIEILGVDLGKNACSIVGVDTAGAIVTRRSMRRQTLID
jgi:hypothetical protein